MNEVKTRGKFYTVESTTVPALAKISVTLMLTRHLFAEYNLLAIFVDYCSSSTFIINK